MERIGSYAYKATTSLGFEDAIEKVTALLAEAGFGILTEIDVARTMKKKLNVEFKPYRILGACNPPLAHTALAAESLVGVLLPCNFVVIDEGESRTVAAMNPDVISTMINNEEMIKIASEVGEHIRNVMEQVDALN